MADDLLEACISDITAPGQDRDYKAFQETFCLRCRNAGCVHAKWVADRFGARVATQPERFFHPRTADIRHPKYSDLVDFTDKFREAMRLEIANKRNDWEIPEVPIIDGRVEQGALSTTDVVDEAVRALAKSKGQRGPVLPDHKRASVETFVEETEALMAEENSHCEVVVVVEEPPPKPSPPATPYPRGNTPIPLTGLMVGGGATPPAPQPAPQSDDWTPKPKERKVSPGATVKMGVSPESPESE